MTSDPISDNVAAPRSKRPWRIAGALGIFGPGLIAASAGNDAGGIITYASAGAQFAYRTLFVMVLVTVGLVIVQEMAARLGVYTGQGLVSLIREHFPLRLAAGAATCLVIANLGLIVSEFAGIAAAFEHFGVSRYLSVPLAAVGIWAAVALGSYRYAERVFLILTVAFVAYPIAAILGHPDWGTVAHQTLLPHLERSTPFVLLVVALIGTTITPYMQLYQASAVVDKGAGPADYRRIRIDSTVGAISACVVSMTIIVATAAAIGGTGPLTSAAQAGRALQPAAGAGAETLFALGLLGASALAAAVVPLSTAYAIAEAVGVERSVSRSFREAPLFLGLFTGQIVLGAAVALIPGNLVELLINTQILNGLVTPVILTFILLLANRTSVLGAAANTPRYRAVATVCITAIAAMAALVVVQTMFGVG
jgi:NRAMP (natural resistance-associated macrophage protein)-like metal ion transporter